MREFKYDVVKLLQGVRERPCLWDKTKDNYKDRVERRTAWEEIFSLLDERYPDMTPEEKRETGEHIMNKWQNTRDTFIRTLRIGRNGRPKRKYLFHEHLKFLTKVAPESCNPEFLNDDFQESESKRARKKQPVDDESDTYNDEESKPYEFYIENIVEKSNDFEDSSDNEVYQRPKKKLKKEKSNTSVKESEPFNNDINFVEVDETNNPRLMNEDEAFFASLLPTVVRYNEDERLEFRIEVLNVMNRIREKQRSCD